MVVVIDEISIGQRRGGSRHGTGQLVISHLLCQYITNPIHNRTTIHLLTCINDGATETDPHLHGCRVPLKEEADKVCGEVDCLVDLERSHLCVRDGEGSQEVGVMVKGQRYIYDQVRENVDREPDLM